MLSAQFIAKLFRFQADFLHVASKYVLMSKIKMTKSCSGLSLKTQILYAIVFICRYLDLFDFRFLDSLLVYNTIMKVLFIGTQFFIIYLMRFKFYSTYDRKWDKFNILIVIVPSIILSYLLSNKAYGFRETLYVFSLILESVAILPQLVQLEEAGESETMTSNYVLLLGLYRTSYTISFAIKKLSGQRIGNVLLACGIIQTVLYIDFFVIYYKYVFKTNGTTKLPSTNEKSYRREL